MRNTRVSQKSLSSLTKQHYIYKYIYSIIWLLRQEVELGRFCWSIPLPISQPVLQRARRSTASKSSSSITAEPKIAPARIGARPLNTLLQHCHWTNTNSWSTYTNSTHVRILEWLLADIRTYTIKENTSETNKAGLLPLHHTSFRLDARQRHSISRLLTADRAQIHGPLSAPRQGWREGGVEIKSRGEKYWADGQDWTKTTR